MARSADDWFDLCPDETVEWEGRPRLSAALPTIAGGVLLVGVGIYLAILDVGSAVVFALIAVAAGVLTAIGGVVRIRRTRYLVTERSLGIRTGVFRRSVASVPLSKVQDSSYSQSVTGRLFGYGTVSFETAGGDGVGFERIDDPSEVRRLVDRRRRGRDVDLPGSLEQWQAVRADVAAIRAAFDRR